MFDVNFALLTSIFCFLFLLLLGGFDLYPLLFFIDLYYRQGFVVYIKKNTHTHARARTRTHTKPIVIAVAQRLKSTIDF